jgi:hypothetical protein
MDFREYAVVPEGDEIIVVGTIRDPVNWDFSIRVCEDDIAGMTKLILRPEMIRLLLRSIFRRRKKHHWTQDYPEHVAEGKQRVIVAWEKVAERVRLREESGGSLPADAGPARRRSRAEPTGSSSKAAFEPPQRSARRSGGKVDTGETA